jgi:hypothetical protein
MRAATPGTRPQERSMAPSRHSVDQHSVDRPRATLDRIALWLAGQAMLIAALAWAAFHLQQEAIAPAVLFPLCVGAALGWASAAVSRAARWPGVRAAVATAACWGLLLVVAEDYIGHRHRERLYEAALAREQSPLAALAAGDPALRPAFADYLAGKVRSEPVWWCLDVLILGGASALIAALRLRGPAAAAHDPAQ